jgi:hypothetical protein
VETDLMADQGQPILSLVSHVFLGFLGDHARIIERLNPTHAALLYYVLQQIQQFRHLGKKFAMQHKDSEFLPGAGQVVKSERAFYEYLVFSRLRWVAVKRANANRERYI